MRVRTLIINRDHSGRPLVEVLCAELRLSRKAALEALQARQVLLNGKCCTQSGRQVKAGHRVQIQMPDKPKAPRPPAPDQVEAKAKEREIRLIFADEHIIVIDKPAGLTTVRHADEAKAFGSRAQKFLPPTLIDRMPGVLAQNKIKFKGRVRAVHRLDKETSGIIVLACTPEAESALGKQFRAHKTITRRYVALVRGHAVEQRIESHIITDRGDGRRGSSEDDQGQFAITEIFVLEKLGDYTLVECQLETGRTHQVRIHLGEAGTPLCGERIYDRPINGTPLPDDSGARRPMLHAASLEIQHPETGERVRWTSGLPKDMKSLVERFRKGM